MAEKNTATEAMTALCIQLRRSAQRSVELEAASDPPTTKRTANRAPESSRPFTQRTRSNPKYFPAMNCSLEIGLERATKMVRLSNSLPSIAEPDSTPIIAEQIWMALKP